MGEEPRGCPCHRQTGCRIPPPVPLRPSIPVRTPGRGKAAAAPSGCRWLSGAAGTPRWRRGFARSGTAPSLPGRAEIRAGLLPPAGLTDPPPSPPAQLANPLHHRWLISWIPLRCLLLDALICFHCCWLGSIPSTTSSSAHRTSVSPPAWRMPLYRLLLSSWIPSITSPLAHKFSFHLASVG